MNKNNPIGIFDSGVGGLSVLKEALKILPQEDFIYFGDTLRVPYGDKSQEELLVCTRRILDFFKLKNVKLVIVACNTCSANTLPVVKNEYDFEILGLIEPTANYVKTLNVKKIGLIATTATVNSQAYPIAIKKFAINVLQQNCPELVKFVERGETYSKDVIKVLENYLKPLMDEKIEKLILGCTHYPFLIPAMKSLGLSDEFFINPAICLSKSAKEFLLNNNIVNYQKSGRCQFFVSGNPDDFKRNAKLFFGEIEKVQTYK